MTDAPLPTDALGNVMPSGMSAQNTPSPVLPIPNALPPQQSEDTDTAEPQQIGSFAQRMAQAADALQIPSGPGGWAKNIIAATMHAISGQPIDAVQPSAPATGWRGAVSKGLGVAQALTSSLGDANIGTVPEGGGALTGVTRALQNRSERLSKEETDKFLHAETQARTISLTRNAYRQDQQDRQASYSQVKSRIDSMRADHAVQDNISQSQLTKLIQENPQYLDTHTGGPVGEEPQLDANGKPMVDPKTGNPIYSPVYSLAEIKTKDGSEGIHKITQAEHDYLKRNGGPDLPVDTPLPTDKFLYVSTKAQGVEDARRRIEKSNDDEMSAENQRQIAGELQDHSIQHYISMVPGEPLGGLYQAQKNAQDHIAVIDKQIAQVQQAAQANPPVAGSADKLQQLQQQRQQFTDEQQKINHVITFGFNDAAKKNYQADLEEQRKQTEVERHNRVEEQRQAKAEQDKQKAQNSDHTDAFGNKSTLSDKEFDKRYDTFTGSNQNKTLQTLQGSYQQFGDILKDVNAGKDMTGAESVVGLFNAIGISATPLAGKGFRINNSTVQEHADALGWGDRITRQGLKVKEGDVITPDQLKAYASIATEVYKHAYVNAANEQMRTLGYIDVLPRGNNQAIDPLTHAMYLQVAGGNQQKAAQAEQKQGWAVNPVVTPPNSGKSVSLTAAMALPVNKGKTEAQVRADIVSHGHQVGQ